MKACADNERCAYWEFKEAIDEKEAKGKGIKASKSECTLLSHCAFGQGQNYQEADGRVKIIDRPQKKKGMIMGARKCQSVEDTKDDRGMNSIHVDSMQQT